MAPAEASTDPVSDGGTLRLSGDIDLASEAQWREQGDLILAADPELAELTLDMAEVSFLDSRGMAMLVHLYTRMIDRGGRLVLTDVPRRVAKALAVAGLDQLFELRLA